MAFVQIQQSLIYHRKTFELADLLDMDRYAVVGRLVALWAWCLDNALTGCLGTVRPRVLAHIMGYDGDPDGLLQALLIAGFIEVGADGLYWIHDWGEHMGKLLDQRESHADAQRRYRERVKAGSSRPETASAATAARDDHVTITRRSRDALEKSREEKSISLQAISLDGENAREPTDALSPSAAVLPSEPQTLPVEPAHHDHETPNETRNEKPKRARASDPLWDACVVACEGGPTNDAERGKWNRGLKMLRQSGAVPEEVLLRAQRFRARYGPDIPLHPMSLASNWRPLEKEVTSVADDTRAKDSRIGVGSAVSRVGGTTGGSSSQHPRRDRDAGRGGGSALPGAGDWARYKQSRSTVPGAGSSG